MSARPDDTPTIRRMTLSDLDSVIAIEREVFLFPWTRGNFSDSVNAGYHCLVLDQEGHLFGYGVMTVAAEEAHLLTLSIATECQGKGWGERLLRHFIQIAGASTRVRYSWTCACPIRLQPGYMNGSDSDGSAGAETIILRWRGVKIL